MIVCWKCNQKMLPARTGEKVILADEPTYRTVAWGDRFACPRCGNQVVSNFGQSMQEFKEGVA